MAFENILYSKHVIITVNIDDEIKEHFHEMFISEIEFNYKVADLKVKTVAIKIY